MLPLASADPGRRLKAGPVTTSCLLVCAPCPRVVAAPRRRYRAPRLAGWTRDAENTDQVLVGRSVSQTIPSVEGERGAVLIAMRPVLFSV